MQQNITDKAVPIIDKFSQLIYLKTDHTNITAPALAQLKDLKLKQLVIPQDYWKVDVNNLQKNFKPGVIESGNTGLTKDIEVEFAPLK